MVGIVFIVVIAALIVAMVYIMARDDQRTPPWSR